MGESQRQGVFFSIHTGLLFSLFRAISFISFLSRSRCASYTADLSCQRRLLPKKCWVSVFILPQLLVSLPHLLYSFMHTTAKHFYLVTQRHRKFSVQWLQAWLEKCERLKVGVEVEKYLLSFPAELKILSRQSRCNEKTDLRILSLFHSSFSPIPKEK